MTLAVGLFASGWPEHIRAHPYWVAIVFLVGAALFAISFFPIQSPQKEDLKQENFVGRDNSGDQIIAKDSVVHTGDVHHHYPPVAIDVSDVTDPISKPLPSQPELLRLSVRREWRDIVYAASPGRWTLGDKRDPQSKDGVLLWLSNLPAAKGQKGSPARNLVAQLTFHHMNGRTHVPRAYWLDNLGHQVDIGNGYELAVIVGYFDFYDAGFFFSNENPHPHDGLNQYFDVPFRELGKRYDICCEKSFSVDVSIINVESDETIEQKRLEIMMPYRVLSMVDNDPSC